MSDGQRAGGREAPTPRAWAEPPLGRGRRGRGGGGPRGGGGGPELMQFKRKPSCLLARPKFEQTSARRVQEILVGQRRQLGPGRALSSRAPLRP